MYFVRRDAILLAATVMIVLAAWMYLDLAYAAGIGAAIFFGLKGITSSRKAAIAKQVGEGICAECGEGVAGGRCPRCDAEGE